MKHISILAGLLVVVGAGIYGTYQNQPVEVMNEKAEVEEETTPDCMTVIKDEDACKAAEDVIYRKELQAELDALEANFGAIKATYEAEVANITATYKANEEEYTNKKKELEIKIGVY